jgi:hypothetical protein
MGSHEGVVGNGGCGCHEWINMQDSGSTSTWERSVFTESSEDVNPESM